MKKYLIGFVLLMTLSGSLCLAQTTSQRLSKTSNLQP